MRICQVVASWGDGGLEKHVAELSNALCAQHEVSVIAHPDSAARFDPAVRFLPVDFSRGRWSPSLYRDLLRALRSQPFDIVHAQANKAASLVGRLRPWVAARGFVATLHNRKGSTRMYDRFDRVITVSPGIAPLVRRAPVTVIYNGIRATPHIAGGRALLAAEFGFDPARPVLLGLGRLVEAKGFDLLVPAAARAGVQVLIAGDGPMRDSLAAQIRVLRAPVVLAGFRSDAPRLVAAADGLVVASRHEGGPYTLPEALLACTPVISTRVGMVPEFLPPSLLVAPGDEDALAALLGWTQANEGAWQALMQPVFRRAQSELTLDAMVAKTVAVYEGLLGNNA